MALKPDREVILWDMNHFMPETGTPGGIVMATGSASGASMDQSTNMCHYAPDPSGRTPLGILDANVVNIDLTRQPLNPFKAEAQINDKVPLIVQGWVTTTFVATGGSAVTVGDPAYALGSGFMGNEAGENGQNPHVGYFQSTLDEDGYYRVQINIRGGKHTS